MSLNVKQSCENVKQECCENYASYYHSCNYLIDAKVFSFLCIWWLPFSFQSKLSTQVFGSITTGDSHVVSLGAIDPSYHVLISFSFPSIYRILLVNL